MYWDRFDICEAWYLALHHCHGGQGSKEYQRASTMHLAPLYFKPSPMLDIDTLTENGREIYDAACERLLQESMRQAIDANPERHPASDKGGV